MSPIDYVWETVKYAGITDVDTQRAINILEDNDMRVLKGWTKDEQKELEEAKGNGFLSAIKFKKLFSTQWHRTII